jgi:hypothetical protein
LKWEAWSKLGNISRSEAEERYVAFLTKLDPSWEKHALPAVDPKPPSNTAVVDENDEFAGLADPDSYRPGSDEGGGNVVMSAPMLSQEELDAELAFENSKTIFSLSQDGNIQAVIDLIASGDASINDVDENGLSALHWACDKGNIDLVRTLIKLGADPNRADNEGQSPLNYACSNDHDDLAIYLITVGGDPRQVDNDGNAASYYGSKELQARISHMMKAHRGSM